jgi:hypothetical protein
VELGALFQGILRTVKFRIVVAFGESAELFTPRVLGCCLELFMEGGISTKILEKIGLRRSVSCSRPNAVS